MPLLEVCFKHAEKEETLQIFDRVMQGPDTTMPLPGLAEEWHRMRTSAGLGYPTSFSCDTAPRGAVVWWIADIARSRSSLLHLKA